MVCRLILRAAFTCYSCCQTKVVKEGTVFAIISQKNRYNEFKLDHHAKKFNLLFVKILGSLLLRTFFSQIERFLQLNDIIKDGIGLDVFEY